MSTIVTRAGKGSSLTWAEGDANVTNLNTDKYESGDNIEVAEAIVGDPGTETSGINISGVTYESTFKVSDIDGTNYAQTILHRHSTTLEPLIVGARCNSNTSAHADVTAGQNLFTIYGVGYAGSNYKLGASISLSVGTGTISNTSLPGKITMSTTPDGAVVPVLRFTIDETGLITLGAGQIKFPATQNPSSNANTLDDYEEGTFALTDASGGGLSITSLGRYVKIGRLVHIECSAEYPVTGDGNNSLLTGLPFVTSGSPQGGFTIGLKTLATISSVLWGVSGQDLSFRNDTGGNLTNTDLSAQSIFFSGTYMASA